MSRNFAQLHGELAPRVAPEIVKVAVAEEKGAAVSEQRYTSWSFARSPRPAP